MNIAIRENQQAAHCFFGASIEATSALRTAAHSNEKIKTLVSDGGRPDLAITELPQVTAPTLWGYGVICLLRAIIEIGARYILHQWIVLEILNILLG